MKFYFSERDENVVAPLIEVGFDDLNDRGSMLGEKFAEELVRHHYLLPDSGLQNESSKLDLIVSFPKPATEGTLLYLQADPDDCSIGFYSRDDGKPYCNGGFQVEDSKKNSPSWRMIKAGDWLKAKPFLTSAENFVRQALLTALDVSRGRAQGVDESINPEIPSILQSMRGSGEKGQDKVLGYPCISASLVADVGEIANGEFFSWELYADTAGHCNATAFREYRMTFKSSTEEVFATADLSLLRMLENANDLTESVKVNLSLEPY